MHKKKSAAPPPPGSPNQKVFVFRVAEKKDWEPLVCIDSNLTMKNQISNTKSML